MFCQLRGYPLNVTEHSKLTVTIRELQFKIMFPVIMVT